jgi:hypothetical protein
MSRSAASESLEAGVQLRRSASTKYWDVIYLNALPLFSVWPFVRLLSSAVDLSLFSTLHLLLVLATV